jgi:hypothetical protein
VLPSTKVESMTCIVTQRFHGKTVGSGCHVKSSPTQTQLSVNYSLVFVLAMKITRAANNLLSVH